MRPPRGSLLVLAALHLACGRGGGPTKLAEATAEERARAGELLQRFSDGEWSQEELEGVSPETLFHLTRTETDPRLLAAALKHASESDEPFILPRELHSLVLVHLDSGDAALKARALDAALQLMVHERVEQTPTGAWVTRGTDDVKRRLSKVAAEDARPAARRRALRALARVSSYADDPEIADTLHAALSDDAAVVVTTALFLLRDQAYRVPARGRFVEATTRLLAHADPGVRGRAALVLAGMARAEGQEGAASEAIEPLLGDPHGFTRAAAATAVARLGQVRFLPTLVRMLDDHAEARYELGGWTTLLGEPGVIVHLGSPWSRVDDAALSAIAFLAGSERTAPLARGVVDPADVDGSLRAEAARAREWFAQQEMGGGTPSAL